MAKKVKLYHPLNATIELDKDHADRVMKRANNGGWSRTPIKKGNAVNGGDQGHTGDEEE